MRKVKIGFLSLFSMIFIFSTAFGGSAFATDDSNLEGATIIEEHEVEGDPNASVDFIDPELVEEPSKDQIGARGVEHEVYSHSTYTWDSSSIDAYNVGPITNQTFLISVAAGQTKKMSHSVTVSGTVTIEATVSGPLSQVIKAGLTGTASGTVSYTYNTTTSYSGPNAPYNTRDYYGAIEYDRHTTKVKKYDVYDRYNGNIKVGTVNYYQGLVTTSNVKKPKNVVYSKDFIN